VNETLQPIGGEGYNSVLFAAVALFLAIELAALFSADYRKAMRMWCTLEDPLGLRIWRDHAWVRISQGVVMLVAYFFIR